MPTERTYIHEPTLTYPLTEELIKQECPNTSFAQPFEPPAEYVEVTRVSPPAHDSVLQVAVETDPLKVNGKWTQQWTVQSKPAEQVQAETDTQSGLVRAERNAKLSSSDWTQVLDAPVDKAAWAAYRQALRDISKQSGFPWTVAWPDDPLKKSAN